MSGNGVGASATPIAIARAEREVSSFLDTRRQVLNHARSNATHAPTDDACTTVCRSAAEPGWRGGCASGGRDSLGPSAAAACWTAYR
jgi:hypothetical protein